MLHQNGERPLQRTFGGDRRFPLLVQVAGQIVHLEHIERGCHRVDGVRVIGVAGFGHIEAALLKLGDEFRIVVAVQVLEHIRPGVAIQDDVVDIPSLAARRRRTGGDRIQVVGLDHLRLVIARHLVVLAGLGAVGEDGVERENQQDQAEQVEVIGEGGVVLDPFAERKDPQGEQREDDYCGGNRTASPLAGEVVQDAFERAEREVGDHQPGDEQAGFFRVLEQEFEQDREQDHRQQGGEQGLDGLEPDRADVVRQRRQHGVEGEQEGMDEDGAGGLFQGHI